MDLELEWLNSKWREGLWVLPCQTGRVWMRNACLFGDISLREQFQFPTWEELARHAYDASWRPQQIPDPAPVPRADIHLRDAPRNAPRARTPSTSSDEGTGLDAAPPAAQAGRPLPRRLLLDATATALLSRPRRFHRRLLLLHFGPCSTITLLSLLRHRALRLPRGSCSRFPAICRRLLQCPH